MPRTTRGVTSHRRHKRLLARAAGFRGRRKNVFRVARQAVIKAGQYAYRDRRTRRRQLRALWVLRINAAARQHGLSYSRLLYGLRLARIEVDRKILADLCVRDAGGFSALCTRARGALPGGAA
jgi:large subunit ribosomal protein L20